MTALNETRQLGTAGLHDECLLQDSEDSISLKPQTPSVQAQIACRELRRDFLVECLRIAGLEANRAANDFAAAFDSRATVSMTAAVINLREATEALVEMRRRP